MEPSYLTAFVGLTGSITTILGVFITSRTQIANQSFINRFQLELAREKSQHDAWRAANEAATSQLANAHKLLSFLGREFSVTGLNIMWTATMSVENFNAKYMALCEKADELLMIVDFHAPEASDACRDIYGQMSMFWGNFGNVLHLTASGKKVDSDTHCFKEAHKAATALGQKVGLAKSLVRQAYQSSRVAEQ